MRAVKLGSVVLRHDYTHQRLECDLLVTTITIAKTIEALGLTDSATIPIMMPAIVNAIQRITRNE
jgi:hypothetical protein